MKYIANGGGVVKMAKQKSPMTLFPSLWHCFPGSKLVSFIEIE